MRHQVNMWGQVVNYIERNGIMQPINTSISLMVDYEQQYRYYRSVKPMASASHADGHGFHPGCRTNSSPIFHPSKNEVLESGVPEFHLGQSRMMSLLPPPW
jgi:hypothetical protein